MVLLIGGCMHGIICVDNGMFLDFFIISHSMHKKQRLPKQLDSGVQIDP